MTRWWRNWFVRRPQQSIKNAKKKRARPMLEQMEDRLAPAISVLQSASFNGHDYLLLSAESWTNSEAFAQSVGGHLATVNDQGENDFIWNTFGQSSDLWIGFNDAATEGIFDWASVQAVTFTAWAAGEPDDAGGVEDYTAIIAGTGEWNDLADGASDVFGIVEIETSSANVTLPAGGGSFTLQVDVDGNTEIVDGSNNVIYQASGGFLTSLTIDGTAAGDDSLTIDFSNGNPIPADGVAFDGGAGGDDALSIQGGTFTKLTYNTAPGGAGAIDLDGAVISFTGLEPITITSVAGTVQIDIDDGNVTANEALASSITDGGDDGDDVLFFDAPGTAEDMTFPMPTVALIVNGDTDDDDAITISSVDADFRAAVAIDGQGGTDAITVDAVLTLGSLTSDGALSLTAEIIDVNQSIDTTAVTTGTITLSGATVNLGANLSTDGATVTISGSTAVVIEAATVIIDTESGDDGSAGAVTFAGTALIRADAANRNLVINTDTSNLGSSNGDVTLAAFGDDGVAFVNDVTIDADDPATTGATVTIPAVSEIAGTLSITAGPIASNATFTAGAATAISLTSDADITDGNLATANFVAQSLTAISATGIDLDTTIATLTLASVSDGGDISISDTAGGLTVTSATTGGTGGNITVEATGGDLVLTLVDANGSGAVVASTTTSGDIVIDSVDATGQSIQVTSAGEIREAADNDAGVDLMAATITLQAASGIGTATIAIEVDANTALGEGLTATVSGPGLINLHDPDAVRVNNLQTANGDITFSVASGNLTLATVTVGGTNTATLTVSSGAVVDANAASTNVTATTLDLTASGAIGSLADPLEIDVTNLSADTTNSNQFLSEADSLTWNTSSAGNGTITLLGGRFNVGGSQTITASAVTVTSPAILGGTGTIDGDVTGTGTVAPGTSPGILNTGDFGPVGTLAIELNGNGPGDNDQVDVSGSVNVTGTILDITLGFTPAANDSFVIVSNNAGDNVTGTFFGLPEGQIFSVGSVQFQITYDDGPGNNDITLTVFDPANPTINGANNKDDLFVVRKDGANVQVFLNGNLAFQAPIASVTGVMTLNGRNGSDTAHIDYSADGFFDLDITFNGGNGSDKLAVEGDGFTSAVYTPSVTTEGDGDVTVDAAAVINFTDAGAVDLFGMATATLSLPGANDTLSIANGSNLSVAAGAIDTIDALVVSGTTDDSAAGAGDGTDITTVAFFNNATVVIDTTVSDGSDTITITDADNAHNNTNLTITTGATGTDVLDVDGATTVTGTFTAGGMEDINLSGNITAATITGDSPNVDVLNDSAQIQDGIELVATGGTVHVAAGTFAESLTIAKALTLDGAGVTTIIDPAAGNGITVSGAAADNVTIQDLRVTGGVDGINASGVDNLTITNVQADNNTDDGIDLSAITGLGTLSDIVGSNNGGDGLVGTSLNTGGTVTIADSVFDDNTGEGVFLTTVGAVTTSNVDANSNSNTGVRLNGAASFTDSGGSSFSANATHGLVLANITGNISLTNTTADNNNADLGVIGDGVNITDAFGGDLLITGGNYRDTDGAGAGVVQQGGIVVSSVMSGSVTISGATVTGNRMVGLRIADGGTTASISTSTFDDNGGDGMNLNSFSGAVTWTGVSADGNTGNGLTATALSGSISGSSFDNNGRGIFFNGGTLTIGTTTIDNNTSTGDGAGLLVEGGNLTLNDGTTVTNNDATGSGGGISFSSTGALTISGNGTTVDGNSAGTDGGGIAITNGVMTIEAGADIIDNRANLAGGGIHITGGAATHTITGAGTTVSGNRADNDGNFSGDGGGINATAGDLTISAGAVVGGTANTAFSGGGINWTSAGALTITGAGTAVSSNTAANDAGGIAISNGTLTLEAGADVTNNRANNHGGGIQITGGAGTHRIRGAGTTVSGNIANDDGLVIGNGGGVRITAGDLAISDAAVIGGTGTGNQARSGGGLAVEGGTVTATDVQIRDNTAVDGGGIHISAGVGHSITTSILAGNTATAGSGGGINVTGGAVTVTESTIGGATATDGNTAVNGGGVAVAGGTVDIVRSAVANNVATGNGGGIAQTLGTLTVVNSTVSTNSGVGVHVSGGAANLNHATVAQNDGDGVAQTGLAVVNATQSLFAENTGVNFSGTMTSGGHNLFEDAAVTGSALSDLLNADALLADLDLYGANTLSHALLPGSPALDAVLVDALNLATDQRGIARPQISRADIGAFESRGFTITLVTPTSPAPGGDTKHRALISHTFVADTGAVCVPIDFTATIQAVAAGIEPIEGGVITFSSDPEGDGSGSQPVVFTIGAPVNNQATFSTNIVANGNESTPGDSYNLRVRAGGDNVSLPWQLFNQIVTKIVASGQPQTTRSGDVIRFASGPNAEVTPTYLLFDQEVTAANQATSVVKFNNEQANDQVTLDPIKVLATLPNFDTGESAIFNVVGAGVLDGAGNVTIDTDACGEVSFNGLKIYQSSFTRLYRLRASFTNPDGTLAVTLSEPFRIVPHSTDIDLTQTAGQFFFVRRRAPIVTLVRTSRGFVRVVKPFRSAQKAGLVNQVAVRAFDVTNEIGGLGLASTWDGPIDITIPQTQISVIDTFGKWQLLNPKPGGAERSFLGSTFVVRAIATGGQAIIRGISPAANNQKRFFIRSKLTLAGNVITVGNFLLPNETHEDTKGPFSRVAESRHLRK